jgi:predicted DNA-binding transcriptional regulator YafY
MPLRPIPRTKQAHAGRPGGKFIQARRLDLMREKLEAHPSGLTLEALANALRVTTRSVRRYLDELRKDTDLEHDAVRRGGEHIWRIKPSERGRTVALRRTQAYALLAARRVFDVLRGSALYDEVDLALRQIDQVAHRPMARTPPRADGDAHLEDRFAYVPPLPRAYGNRGEDVDAAFQAVADRTVLRFRYGDGSDGAPTRGARITAHPYALVLQGGTITCVARDVDRATTRAFVLDRMVDLQTTEAERFQLPDDFAIADWLHGDFGVALAPRTVKLMVEFDPRAADSVRARKVHPSQKNAVSRDGRVRASLSVPETPEVLARVRAWVLGFGAAAQVIEPAELVADVAAELRRAAARYGA